MAKAQKKADERLQKRIDGYEETMRTMKGSNAGAYHRPGSRKKVH